MLYARSRVIFLQTSSDRETRARNEGRVADGETLFSSTQKPGKLLQMNPSLGGLIKQLTLQN